VLMDRRRCEDVECIGALAGTQRQHRFGTAAMLNEVVFATSHARGVVVEHRARGAPDDGDVVAIGGVDHRGDGRDIIRTGLPDRRQDQFSPLPKIRSIKVRWRCGSW